jgi:hypothetical protein
MSSTSGVDFDPNRHIDYLTFEHMTVVVTEKKLHDQIFLIDSDPELLVDLVKKVASTDTDAVKIGVLYRACGHTTPFCIEKVMLDDDEEVVVVYNTDSMALDGELVDQAREEIQKTVRILAEDFPVYSLAFENAELAQIWKRQFDQGSCATFALFDLEQILAMEMGQFYDFAKGCSRKLDDENPNIFVLGGLPVCLMAAIQSVQGRTEHSIIIRSGLMIPTGNDDTCFSVNGEITTMRTLRLQVTQSGLFNPIIAIANQQNLDLFRLADLFETPPGTLSRNRLPSLGNIIFDSSVKQNDQLHDREDKSPLQKDRISDNEEEDEKPPWQNGSISESKEDEGKSPLQNDKTFECTAKSKNKISSERRVFLALMTVAIMYLVHVFAVAKDNTEKLQEVETDDLDDEETKQQR